MTSILILSLVLVCANAGEAADAGKKKKLTLAVSIYAGWMPWYYAKEQGILKKWGDKYGLDINVNYMDYAPSLDAFVAGQADACVMTNMECLDMPASAGVDSSAIIMGDYSNGNDAILTRSTCSAALLRA
jgi:NitT/TauT family transport system substrate-binding protein